ncbi:MAG: YCF48-related protein [Blastocatellia bacterium]
MVRVSNSWNGWVVGNNGTILKTTNGGDAWTAQTSGTAANLRDVYFVDANHGWAVGDSGVILTTSDGGATWSPEQSGVAANLRGVFFANANTGFAVGDGGVILKRGVASGPTAVTSVSAASFAGAELAAESIAAAFGQGLATATEAASSIPLPTTLAGASIRVRDSAGMERMAPLFFVSPLQINYQIPLGTAPGAASISVVGGGTVVAAGTAPITAVAPGLFAANASGQGVAAAVVFRRKADGSESFEAVALFDQSQNRFVAAPIDLGPETDQVSLILFGTGIRFRSALSAVTCNIGGASAPVFFAGAQGGFVGLDQANVSLPRSLAGRGEVDVMLTVDGKPANSVKIAIK